MRAIFLPDGTFVPVPAVPEALHLEGFRRAVLAFLAGEHALSEELRSRMLGWHREGRQGPLSWWVLRAQPGAHHGRGCRCDGS